MKTDKKYPTPSNKPPRVEEPARAYHAKDPLSLFSGKERAFLEDLFEKEAKVFEALAK